MNVLTTLKALTLAVLVSVGVGACAYNSNPQPESGNAVNADEHKPNMNAEVLEPYTCGTVQRLNTLGGVFLASQPEATDLEQASKGGIKLVVNLRKDSEMTFDEKAVVEKNGMAYKTLPWNGADELTPEVLTEMRRIFREDTRPMLVHCSSGNRVGAGWLAYRVLDNGISWSDALAEAKTVGMKTPAYETIVEAYVKRMK